MTTESTQYLATLHQQINKYFNFSEVKTICFNLGVDHENIPGNIRSAFIRNLIVSMAKRNRLQELVDHVKAERPFVKWQNVPANFELPDSIAQEDIQQVINYTVYGDLVQGDKVGGDKVSGDKISVGNISGGEGIAIGSGASANVEKKTVSPTSAKESSAEPAGTPAPTDTNVQKAVARLEHYLQMPPDGREDAVDELLASINIILAVTKKRPLDTVHLNLLCLGQAQLARNLAADVPGIEKVVAGFVTAVNLK